MQRQVIKHQNNENLHELFRESCFSGERFLLMGNDGIAVGIVPIEDLEILEEMEANFV